MAAHGLLQKSELFVVTSHRVEIGKVDIELGGSLPVICLCPDPRDAAFGWDPGQFSGWDALIIGTQRHIPDVQQQYGQILPNHRASGRSSHPSWRLDSTEPAHLLCEGLPRLVSVAFCTFLGARSRQIIDQCAALISSRESHQCGPL